MTVLDINAVAARDVVLSKFQNLHPQFPGRWSPRAMTGLPLTESQLTTLIEAARWAPSCFNSQPWRFAYTLNGDDHWPLVLGTLMDANQSWARNAGALIAVASRRRFEHNDQPAPTHAFDAGAAWMSLALQAAHMGLVAHGMYGFDQAAAREALRLPELYELCAFVAVGHPGERDDLPERLRERETPSTRKALAEICCAGTFEGLQ
ncbi:MAG: nitroreductase family protein [Pseudomonadales bacterium]